MLIGRVRFAAQFLKKGYVDLLNKLSNEIGERYWASEGDKHSLADRDVKVNEIGLSVNMYVDDYAEVACS